MSKKDIEVLIKVPRDWLTTDDVDILQALTGRTKARVSDEVMDAAVKKIIESIELPKIEINSKEVKDRMLDIMARRALDDNE